MKLSKHLLSKAVAIAAICATMGTTTLAAPQGTFDTSEINITGQASRSVAPNHFNTWYYKPKYQYQCCKI